LAATLELIHKVVSTISNMQPVIFALIGSISNPLKTSTVGNNNKHLLSIAVLEAKVKKMQIALLCQP
jgi:hypothetical protein